MKLTELHIQQAWQHRLYRLDNLTSSDGKLIEVIHPGYLHHDAGPDFFQARIRIDGTLWVGNVEIHHRSSEWYSHGHDKQASYDNVILHVVLEEDRKVFRRTGGEIPCLELVLLSEFTEKLEEWESCKQWLRCDVMAGEIPMLHYHFILQRLAVDRLERKADEMKSLLQWSLNDWRHVFYYLLARSFGFRINSDPMEQLARSIPLTILSKERDGIDRLEALYFGQSGLLPEKSRDPWVSRLISEYQFLKNKYGLIPLDRGIWKFMRTRPTNFPTIRIAQFVSLIAQSTHLLSQTVEKENIQEVVALFDVTPSEYWHTHYQFKGSSTFKKKRLSKTAIYNIIINTIIPFLMVYGEKLNREDWKEKGLHWLQTIPYEKNYITKMWQQRGFKLVHAMDSQALIALHHQYCMRDKCLECDIGHVLLNNLKH
ncbi:DUF2851 family protein [Halosquirtibacter xylanolyticus]|uniref:DUF2851 family protein n=1 Tax=Halosquirtibacter xylanolyticus TaxID=3374599 RepID=UPI003748772E|nr:DUF2851 family protein [Prolixibacteraceae bacterium]